MKLCFDVTLFDFSLIFIAVCVSIFSYMATVTHSAPLAGVSGLGDDQQFQDLVQRSHILIQKILLSIPDVHKSCIHIESLQLNSSENTKLVIMASNIGIPPAPILRVVSENCTLESNLTQMTEGLLLHRELLTAVLPKLGKKDKVSELSYDIRDFLLQIRKMLKLVQKSGAPTVQPMSKPVTLRLPGEYEIQVAAHLTLVQLEAFAQDVVDCLKNMKQSDEEELDS